MNNRIFGKIFNVYKPVGLSSYDVVRKFKKILNYRKIGHGGTLDPFAEGVLLILVGRKATRQMNELLKLPKSYRAIVQLGKTTATGDPDGKVIKEKSVGSISNKMLDTAIDEFSGQIEQVPPKYSAKKVNGVPAYKLARQGKDFELKPQSIKIYDLSLDMVKKDKLLLDVECSRGTYIRKLGQDIAEFLGTAGYLTKLKRTSIGDYKVDDSIYIDDLEDKLVKTKDKLRKLALVS
ncbi:MAG: tRNA pseudouridine(55) synthase TruB [Candidatus Marinimicrobia bacterium]|nr:tRNA pseudouridine(55) synthase TruB [Candidatus Neomarinimicrobiota bacterium]